MFDETKVQIGNEVLLDVGINPDWYISSVGYEYRYEEKAREVTITLRNKGDENELWRTLGELITDHKDEPTISKMEQVEDEPQTNADQHVQRVESVEQTERRTDDSNT